MKQQLCSSLRFRNVNYSCALFQGAGYFSQGLWLGREFPNNCRIALKQVIAAAGGRLYPPLHPDCSLPYLCCPCSTPGLCLWGVLIKPVHKEVHYNKCLWIHLNWNNLLMKFTVLQVCKQVCHCKRNSSTGRGLFSSAITRPY